MIEGVMNYLKPFLALILISCALASCRSDSQTSDKQVLRLNFFAEPPTLDPRRGNYSIYSNILPMVFDGLMRIDPEGNLVPSVAKEVEVSNDKLTYIFHLRHTLWSNGDPVTAYDFEYAWKWTLNPGNPSPMASHLYCLKNGKACHEGRVSDSQIGVFARDADTLVVELDKPIPFFLELTAIFNFYPVNHHHPDCFDNGGCIGNGPFYLKDWKPGQQITLVKNLRYWDIDNVKLNEIDISFVQDMNTELQLFEKGLLDWAGAPLSQGLPSDAFPKLESNGQLKNHPFLGTYFYSFNTGHPPLDNRKVRQALTYTIPRDDIVKHITQGKEVAATRFMPQQINIRPHQNEQLDDYRARQLFEEGLEESGLSREDLPKLVISYNKSEMHHAIAQTIQHRWKEVFGIDIKLRCQDWKAHLSEVQAGNFDIARLAWKGLSSDPIHFLDIFQDPNHPMHSSGWNHSTFNEYINRATASKDRKKRLFYLAEAEEILTRDMPVAPVYYLTICYVKNPGLNRYVINQLGSIDFKWASFNTDEDLLTSSEEEL